jgi:hypothetical protein
VQAQRSGRGQLTVTVTEAGLDAFVLTLAAQQIAIRRLALLVSPLESMFFALSEGDADGQAGPDVDG